MTTNFVTFYLIIVLITGPFFQFLSMPPESLLWDEILLAKILNQAPTIFILGYLLFQAKKIKQYSIFMLLMAFLTSCIISEIYYYFVSPETLLYFSVGHNLLTYVILIFLLLKIISFKETRKFVILPATIVSIFIALGFSFSAFSIYQEYFFSRPIIFLILISFIISATLIVFLSFFNEKPFQRNWYEIVIGLFLLVVVDIYTYSCFFVFNAPPTLLYTIGKVLFSAGILLLVDGILRKKIKESSLLHAL